ncbi:MAG: RDD family protein [Sporichthyaceae bacterium]|nr:RDD family protein [Sporichthyaceae bacterium]
MSRVLALALDVAVVTIGIGLVVAMAAGAAEMTVGRTTGWVTALVGVVVGLLPVGYFASCWWIGGQTAGNMAMGIAVRRSDGEPLRFPRSLVRAVLGLALAPLWLLGLLLVLADDRRRGLLDLVAGTVVVYTPTGPGR